MTPSAPGPPEYRPALARERPWWTPLPRSGLAARRTFAGWPV